MKKQSVTPRKLALKKIAIADLSENRTTQNNAANGLRSTVGHITLDITVICTLCLQ